MAEYILNQRAFIGGQLLAEGTKIRVDDDFPPGPHMDGADDAGIKARAAYDEANPDATLHPVNDTPMTMEVIGLVPSREETVDLSLAESAATPAKPGPTDGGKVK